MASYVRQRITVLCLLGILAAVLLAGCRSGQQEKMPEPEFVFTYAENQAETYPTTQGAYRFAQLVKERTEGRILIQINAGALMGDEEAVVEQLQFGGLDFARVSISSLGAYVPKLNVLQLPYLYTGSQHMWKVLDGKIGREFMEELEGSGMVGLSWYDAGARSFYMPDRFVRTPEELRGLRIRVQESALMSRMVELMGAIPVQMSYGEVYSALEMGQINGAENNWPSYQSERHYEVAPYMTEDEHARIPELQLVSEATWNKLSKEDQRVLLDCAEESSQYERTLWKERTEKAREQVIAQGCQVLELTEEEKASFRQAVLPLYREFCGDYLDEVDAIVAAGYGLKNSE